MKCRVSGLAALAAFALSFSALGAGEAGGTVRPEDRALAEALFRQGKQLGEEGRIAEACVKFNESQKLDPALGTLLHLAACYEAEGKTASAWAAFDAASDLAAQAGQSERAQLARERASALERALHHLVLVVEHPARDLVVTLDGRELGEAAFSAPLPVDPGQHAVTAGAEGKTPWAHEFEVPSGSGTLTVRVPPLADASVAAAPSVALSGSADAGPSSAMKDRRRLGYIVGGAGLAALAVGTFFGVRAARQKSDADEHCNGYYCSQEGLDGHQAARTSAWIANVGVALGLGGVGVGTYFVISSYRPEPPAGSAQRQGIALSVGGKF